MNETNIWRVLAVVIILGAMVTGVLILRYTHCQSYNQIPIPSPTLPTPKPILTPPSCSDVFDASSCP